jgi:Sodium/hydrogen exchanger family
LDLADRFEVVLLLIAASLALTLAARRLRMPHAGALILGGIGLALIPGMPDVELDPDLTLILFLPPLLLVSAYLTSWCDFRRDLRIILQLAVGAVLFTTLAVGWVTHLVMPGLAWAACLPSARSCRLPMPWPPRPCCRAAAAATGPYPLGGREPGQRRHRLGALPLRGSGSADRNLRQGCSR